MEETKHKTIPYKDTFDMKKIIGKKVITEGGKKIGKVKSIHIHPKKLVMEGIVIDHGMFEVDQYVGANYIESLSDEGAVLKVTPSTEIVGHTVFDSMGKKIGEVKGINRSNQTNTLLSITIDAIETGKDLTLTSDYIAAVGEDTLVLKEPCDPKKAVSA